MVQVVFSGTLAKSSMAALLTLESSIVVCGQLAPDPRVVSTLEIPRIPGFEFRARGFRIAGDSSELPIHAHTSTIHTKLTERHLAIRDPAVSEVLRMRALVLQALRSFFDASGLTELTPPTIVQAQCEGGEGGAELFPVSWYGEEAGLTQSSQLYLETALPAVGDCFCIAPSYRAEKSLTPRHLAEFTHAEAELGFIEFEQLLETIEHMLVAVVDHVTAAGGDVLGRVLARSGMSQLPPCDTFVRMSYSEAVEYLRSHEMYPDPKAGAEPQPLQHGEDIPSALERALVDRIGKPLLLYGFPAAFKAFYMKRCPKDPTLTQSVDLLLPGVGEVVGASMRMEGLEELTEAFARAGVDTQKYRWYMDQRKFGSCPHGGFGLGVERLCCWLFGLAHVRDVCMYPRYYKHCFP
eukprot:TRINITY_DN1431_c0_g1_i1.p1 TRINITY_DN1431_c0_g1~~TRINITY_DN1431_c0_g1_i1.p1  ORF type:complete len:408 (+),score=77.13 TRINITY_DN1431_c0_g1_i1:484-1707(+)